MNKIKTHFEIEAGTLPYRIVDGKIEYLLIFREKLNDYTFPKGHLEHEESLEDAAVRETNEEAGVTSKIEDYIDVFEYKVLEKKKDGTKFYVIRRVYNYLVEVLSEDLDFTNPDLAEGGTSTVWLPFEEAYDKLSYQNVKTVLAVGNSILEKQTKSFSEILCGIYLKIQTDLQVDPEVIEAITHIGLVGSVNDREMVAGWSDLDIMLILKSDNSGTIPTEVLLKLKNIHAKLAYMYPSIEISFLTHTLKDFTDYVAFEYLKNYQYASYSYINSDVVVKDFIQNVLDNRNINSEIEKRYAVYKFRHMRFNLIRMVASWGAKNDRGVAKLIVDRIVESAIFLLGFHGEYFKTKNERLNRITSDSSFEEIAEFYKYANETRFNWSSITDKDLGLIIKTGLDYLSRIEAFIHHSYPEPTPEEFMNK